MENNNSSIVNSFGTMFYKGDFYYGKTKVVLKDEYMEKYKQKHGYKPCKYAIYYHVNPCNPNLLYFQWDCGEFNAWKVYGYNDENAVQKFHQEYTTHFSIPIGEIEEAIEEILTPDNKIPVEKRDAIIENGKKPFKYSNPEPIWLWVVYAIAMIACMVFNQFYIAWIFVTLIFIPIRKAFKE